LRRTINTKARIAIPATPPTTPPITAPWAAGGSPDPDGGAGAGETADVGAEPGTPFASPSPPAPPAASVGVTKVEVNEGK